MSTSPCMPNLGSHPPRLWKYLTTIFMLESFDREKTKSRAKLQVKIRPWAKLPVKIQPWAELQVKIQPQSQLLNDKLVHLGPRATLYGPLAASWGPWATYYLALGRHIFQCTSARGVILLHYSCRKCRHGEMQGYSRSVSQSNA